MSWQQIVTDRHQMFRNKRMPKEHQLTSWKIYPSSRPLLGFICLSEFPIVCLLGDQSECITLSSPSHNTVPPFWSYWWTLGSLYCNETKQRRPWHKMRRMVIWIPPRCMHSLHLALLHNLNAANVQAAWIHRFADNQSAHYAQEATWGGGGGEGKRFPQNEQEQIKRCCVRGVLFHVICSQWQKTLNFNKAPFSFLFLFTLASLVT